MAAHEDSLNHDLEALRVSWAVLDRKDINLGSPNGSNHSAVPPLPLSPYMRLLADLRQEEQEQEEEEGYPYEQQAGTMLASNDGVDTQESSKCSWDPELGTLDTGSRATTATQAMSAVSQSEFPSVLEINVTYLRTNKCLLRRLFRTGMRYVIVRLFFLHRLSPFHLTPQCNNISRRICLTPLRRFTCQALSRLCETDEEPPELVPSLTCVSA